MIGVAKKTWAHVALLALAGSLVAVGARALDRNPLFWEASTGADGVTVRRLVDIEADVNCYVASTAVTNITGAGRFASISCVKVR